MFVHVWREHHNQVYIVTRLDKNLKATELLLYQDLPNKAGRLSNSHSQTPDLSMFICASSGAFAM